MTPSSARIAHSVNAERRASPGGRAPSDTAMNSEIGGTTALYTALGHRFAPVRKQPAEPSHRKTGHEEVRPLQLLIQTPPTADTHVYH